MRFLPQHRTVLIVFAFLVLGGGMSYWFLIRPLHSVIKEQEEDLTKERKRLQKTGYPLNSELLEEEIKRLKDWVDGDGGQPGIRATSQAVLADATRMFMDRILGGWPSASQFRQQAPRTFFHEDFSRIRVKLAKQGVHLAPSVLGISDETSSPYIYQLILQIWTVERLADLAAEEGLAIAPVDGVEVDHDGGKAKAADIRLLRVRGYILADTDKKPYLIEFPVEATLLGELDQVKSFLRKLTSRGNFLPPTHVEIYADDPDRPAYRDGRRIKVTGVKIRVQCSSFFTLGSPDTRRGKAANLPGGA
ncbi:MAG: hypothetical protein HN904_11005 [Victivallales bacterium]|nr:hypothetical protein [Victivallales bacterium]